MVVVSAGAFEVVESSEEVIEVVKWFVSKIGDVYVLLRVDMKFIVLVYDLEGRCYGVEYLRTESASSRTYVKKTNRFEK